MTTRALEGFEGLDKTLSALPKKVAKKIVRKATRESAKVTLKQVKANAKSMIGGNMGALIAKHAKVIVFKHQRRGSYGVQIGMKPNVPEFDYWPVGASSRERSGKPMRARSTKATSGAISGSFRTYRRKLTYQLPRHVLRRALRQRGIT